MLPSALSTSLQMALCRRVRTPTTWRRHVLCLKRGYPRRARAHCAFLQSRSESTVSKAGLSNASLTPGVGWRAKRMTRHENQQQQNSQTPNSPPQLFISNESANTSFTSDPVIWTIIAPPPGMGGGGLGLAAPSINLLPAIPVSGGASGNHVPF